MNSPAKRSSHVVLALIFLSVVPAVAAEVTMEDRIEAQCAIERVYYSHVIDAKKPFEEVYTEQVLRKKVEDTLRLSAALEEFWGETVTAEDLEAELRRIAENTGFPDRLAEIYEALEYDSVLIQETLARSTLLRARVRGMFDFDREIQLAARKRVEGLRDSVLTGAALAESSRSVRSVLVPARKSARAEEDETGEVSAFKAKRFEAARERLQDSSPSSIDEDPYRFAFYSESSVTDQIVSYSVPKTDWSIWWFEVGPKLKLINASTVAVALTTLPEPQSKSRFLVSGEPCFSEGAWTTMYSGPGTPSARINHSAVWTGTEMIVSGGAFVSDPSDGSDFPTDFSARYDPLTDMWVSVSSVGAPDARFSHFAAWTGTRMLVWGGESYYGPILGAPGGLYDPATDTWSTMSLGGGADSGARVWTGTEMVHAKGSFSTKYDPGSDTWTLINPTGAANGGQAVWTGAEMMVMRSNTAGHIDIYDPISDVWTAIQSELAPPAISVLVWTDGKLLAWYGHGYTSLNEYGVRYSGYSSFFDTGTGEWSRKGIPSLTPPLSASVDAIWTGTELVFLTEVHPGSYRKGGRYNPAAGKWSADDLSGGPNGPLLVWTGSEAIVWGGGAGGRYANPPSLDTDGDGAPDACDACAGSDDRHDEDLDGTPDGCDVCPGANDRFDNDADGVPDGCEIAALAAELNYDPVKIFDYVRNNFEFELYFGYLKGPQATLETLSGNDYDLAALTAELLEQAGFNTRFDRGTAIIPAQDVVDWLKVHNADAANTILNTAGIQAIPRPDASTIDYFEVDRFWLEVEAPLGPSGELSWFPVDTAYKKHILVSGIPGLLGLVPFSESEYFAFKRAELAHEYYAGQIQGYLDSVFPGVTLADVPIQATNIEGSPSSLPRSLPYRLLATPTTYQSIPGSLTHRAHFRVREPQAGPTLLDSPYYDVPDISLNRITISLGAGYPELRIDGLLASVGTFTNLDEADVHVDLFDPANGGTSRTVHHFGMLLDDRIAIGLDAGQASDALSQRQVKTFVEAQAEYDALGSVYRDDLDGAFLSFAIMEWFKESRLALEGLMPLLHFHPVFGVQEGAAFGTTQLVSVAGVPFTEVTVFPQLDIPGVWRSMLSLDGDNTSSDAVRRLANIDGSGWEHAIWEALLNTESISTIKSLQAASELSIDVVKIDNHDADPNNDFDIFAPQMGFTQAFINGIGTQADEDNFTVEIPLDYTPIGDFVGVGWILENLVDDQWGFLISNGLFAGDLYPSAATNGGAPSTVFYDGQVLDTVSGEAPNNVQVGDPVNPANGNFIRTELDFALPALGEPLAMVRFYNSVSEIDGGFGQGWTHNYGDRLIPQPDGTVDWISGDGKSYSFAPGAVAGEFDAPDGVREELVSDASGYTMTRIDKRVQIFDTAGRLVSRSDRNANMFTLAYDASGRLVTVTDPAARSISLTYTATDRIESVSDFSGRTWSYAYGGDDQLSQVTSPSNAETPALSIQYTYDGDVPGSVES